MQWIPVVNTWGRSTWMSDCIGSLTTKPESTLVILMTLATVVIQGRQDALKVGSYLRSRKMYKGLSW